MSTLFRTLLLVSLCFLHLTCKNNDTIESADEISQSLAKAQTNATLFEGRFFRLDKLDTRNYRLLLKNEKDSILTFLTMIPISDTEIGLLKKNGNNIQLYYGNRYNSVEKAYEKVVKSMMPIYEFEK